MRELYKVKPSFVFLQETHFQTGKVPTLHHKYFPKAHHATNCISKSKGVSILISRSSGFEVTQQLVDTEGRYLLPKSTWGSMPLTLANVYFPNKANAQFCRRFIEELKGFASGCIILGGDFNVALNPFQDTSLGNSSLTYRILKNIKMSLQSLTLIDSWNVINPSGKDYTYYSAPHDRY